MEFPKNIAEQLDGDSVGPLRAWRHQVICKLIDAGVTNPKEIESSVETLYNFVVSPLKSEMENIRKNLISIQLMLSSNNNVIATDSPEAKEDNTHWRTNHTQQITAVSEIAQILGINLYSDPQYNCDNKCP
ncbi:hypothetical protein [Acinetobacter oleivorans]|uniref:hypothetical protein n=1 Tax=Acinetobacter oleivorans TaxID=1148157 RepID=UPI00125F26B1|nr:hypothetical protein [Acinetobacter oleivorans]